MAWGIPKSGIKTAERDMERFCKDLTQKGCCSFRMLKWVMDKKRKRRAMESIDKIGAACHAGISHGYHPHLIITASYHRPYHEERMDGYISYLDWLINKSPWQSAFITKDAQKAYDVGVIATSAVAGNILGGGLIAQRQIYESTFYQQVVIWMELVAKGVNENLAFVIAHLGNTNEALSYIEWERTSNNHSPIDSYNLSSLAVRNFMDGYCPAKRMSDPHIECNNHHGVFNSWGKSDGSFRKWWRKHCPRGQQEIVVWGKKKKVDMSDFGSAIDAAVKAANEWVNSEEFMGDV